MTYQSARTALLLAIICGLVSAAQAAKPVPTEADVAYGPEANQRMDLYLPPKSAQRCPAVLWYGAIWKPGRGAPDPTRFLSHGCAIIAVQTRVMSEGQRAGIDAPVAVVLDDACRAVQFVRMNAAKWGIDPERLAVGGSSQGSLPALYVGCSADRANPNSSDPVERVSSKVVCVAAHRSQPSIDPKRMQEWVPGVKWGAPALGCSFEESLKRRDELEPLIAQWSPDALLHKGAAPIYFEYNWGLTKPENVSEMDYLVHSPAWALGFQKLAEKNDVTCLLKYPGHPTEGYQDVWDFLFKQLKASQP